VIGSRRRPSVDQALPCNECEVGGGDRVGAGLVHLGVDRERGAVDCGVALDHLTVAVHEHQSETLMWRKFMPNGFTEKWSSRSGHAP